MAYNPTPIFAGQHMSCLLPRPWPYPKAQAAAKQTRQGARRVQQKPR